MVDDESSIDAKGGITMVNNATQDLRVENDRRVLEQYACRWAVLAAWHDELQKRNIKLRPEVPEQIDLARTKIASGCFSVCEVGCDLGKIEALLTSIDASSQPNTAETWIELLAKSMDNPAEMDRLLKVPAIKFQYVNCKLPCNCG
jgi:hypothetical protein